MKLSLQRPCDNLGRSLACLRLGEFVLDVCRIQWIYIAPNCRQLYHGYLSFSLNVTAWEIFTFGVVAISISCYCFIVLSLSLFIVDSKWVLSLFQLVGLWLTLIYIGLRWDDRARKIWVRVTRSDLCGEFFDTPNYRDVVYLASVQWLFHMACPWRHYCEQLWSALELWHWICWLPDSD